MKKISVQIIVLLQIILILTFSPVKSQELKFSDDELKLLDSIKVIQVIVEQTYEEVKGMKIPFIDYVRKVLSYGGLKVVGNEAKNFDATLSIKAEGYAFKQTFSDYSQHYTGATIEGDIIISYNNKLYKTSFQGNSSKGIDEKIRSNTYNSPYDAPFKEASKNGILPKLMILLKYFRGYEPLIAVVKDQDKNIRNWAVYTLGSIINPSTLKILVSSLKDRDPEVRKTSTEAIESRSDIKTIENSDLESLLYIALHDKNPDIRRSLIKTIGDINDPSVIKTLSVALKDKDEFVRSSAIIALGKIETSQATEILVSVLNGKDKFMRISAAEELGKKNNPIYLELIVRTLKVALKNKEAGEQGALIKVINNFDDLLVPDFLALGLESEFSMVRFEAVRALAKQKSSFAIKPLINALNDSDNQVSKLAENALSNKNMKAAIKPLINTLSTSNTQFANRVSSILRYITDQNFGVNQDAWLNWYEKNKSKFK